MEHDQITQSNHGPCWSLMLYLFYNGTKSCINLFSSMVSWCHEGAMTGLLMLTCLYNMLQLDGSVGSVGLPRSFHRIEVCWGSPDPPWRSIWCSKLGENMKVFCTSDARVLNMGCVQFKTLPPLDVTLPFLPRASERSPYSQSLSDARTHSHYPTRAKTPSREGLRQLLATAASGDRGA